MNQTGFYDLTILEPLGLPHPSVMGYLTEEGGAREMLQRKRANVLVCSFFIFFQNLHKHFAIHFVPVDVFKETLICRNGDSRQQ